MIALSGGVIVSPRRTCNRSGKKEMFEHFNGRVIAGADTLGSLANEIIMKRSFSDGPGDDDVMHLEQLANGCKNCLCWWIYLTVSIVSEVINAYSS